MTVYELIVTPQDVRSWVLAQMPVSSMILNTRADDMRPRIPWRAVDRALQALRKQGAIQYDRKRNEWSKSQP